MRKALDTLYEGAAWLAALFMIALLVAVLLSIAGRELNFHVRGTDAYAGYFMAAAGFLALAHTLKRGEHIRVTLLLSALPPRARRAMELWAHAAAALLSGLLAFMTQMALILLLGHMLANTRPVRRLLRRLSALPQTPLQAYLFVFIIAAVASLIT